MLNLSCTLWFHPQSPACWIKVALSDCSNVFCTPLSSVDRGFVKGVLHQWLCNVVKANPWKACPIHGTAALDIPLHNHPKTEHGRSFLSFWGKKVNMLIHKSNFNTTLNIRWSPWVPGYNLPWLKSRGGNGELGKLDLLSDLGDCKVRNLMRTVFRCCRSCHLLHSLSGLKLTL